MYFIKYQWAYLISYCAGILLSYFLNTRYVFRTQHTWLRFAIFPLIYVVVYALGALTLKFCVDHLRVPATLGPLLSIAVTLPVSFVLTRILLRSDSSAHSQSKTSA
ncbi:GtrA family protein [Xanthomonas campestris pv. campestris]|nr:GtrA family protein [Xanthomonas campestris pv. campestris]